MATQWIKMRAGLLAHPKVVRISSALKADRIKTVGGLYSVWCLFDEHSEDGSLDGYTPTVIDDLIGWVGFASAMESVGWLEVSEHCCALPDFDSHNGQSAKRRAQEAERKRLERAATESADLSASNADTKRTREEKRREEEIPTTDVVGKTPRKRSAPTPVIAKPEDVAQQTWDDWLQHRKTRKAPVTETVLAGARTESASAGMALDAFLQVWCLRGSTALLADWIKPSDRATPSRVQPVSYARQDELDRRARWEEMTNRKWPEAGQPDDFIEAETIPPRRIAA